MEVVEEAAILTTEGTVKATLGAIRPHITCLKMDRAMHLKQPTQRRDLALANRVHFMTQILTVPTKCHPTDLRRNQVNPITGGKLDSHIHRDKRTMSSNMLEILGQRLPVQFQPPQPLPLQHLVHILEVLKLELTILSATLW